MKLSKVTPIFKSGQPNSSKNYRPISVLPSISKILEKVVYKRLYSFLIKHNILSPSQPGFGQNLSTELAILEMQDRIIKHKLEKSLCVGMFLDLSKAFDSLDHSILLDKLAHYGIRGLPLNWFKSYLDNRKQYIHISKTDSEPMNISHGVPQGSILGPLLFIIYVNDLPTNCKNCTTLLFADDTNLLFVSKDLPTLIPVINSSLSNISKWFSSNKLSLNVNKTNYVIFHSVKQKIPIQYPNIQINGISITRVKTTKFLGVHMDETLSWKDHINKKANQVSELYILHYLACDSHVCICVYTKTSNLK